MRKAKWKCDRARAIPQSLRIWARRNGFKTPWLRLSRRHVATLGEGEEPKASGYGADNESVENLTGPKYRRNNRSLVGDARELFDSFRL
jgi:hypothetical protein